MPLVVGVAFRPVTKVYYFDPTGFEDLACGERVVVDTARGRTLGEVVHPPREVASADISGALKPVVRRATALDMVQQDQALHKEAEALAVGREKVAALGLNMKIVRVEYGFDSASMLVYFTAEQRVDFRNLVHELAQALHTRVEMRQIGVRDEAKLLSGFGRCGRELCCALWLREFTPVSIKMAKQQELPLNPAEISGVCGRLLCCLSYENDVYAEARRHMPRINSMLTTPEGPGKVKQVHVMRNSVTVQIQGPNDERIFAEFPLSQLDFVDTAPQAEEGCGGCTARRPRFGSSDEGEEALLDTETLSEDEDERPAPHDAASTPRGEPRPEAAPPAAGKRSRSRRSRRRSPEGGTTAK